MAIDFRLNEYSWAPLSFCASQAGELLDQKIGEDLDPLRSRAALPSRQYQVGETNRGAISPTDHRRVRLAASQCPTARDFVPWRFLVAGRFSAWSVSSSRRPKTCTEPDSCTAANSAAIRSSRRRAAQYVRHLQAERLGGFHFEHRLYFVGACTGRSAGFSPLRIRPT
jgi:hypothetical protein